MRPQLTFWYEFSSTYSYLSAMRIVDEAERAGVDVHWRPFLLGPIFKAQGWPTSPFNLYPAKGRYMVRDIGRIAAARGIAFALPGTFPMSTVKAARLALAADRDAIANFSVLVFRAAFADGRDIADTNVLQQCLLAAGLDAHAVSAHAASDAIKSALRQNTDEAQQRAIFGAPSFTTRDGELFWGDDRLDQALRWARDH